ESILHRGSRKIVAIIDDKPMFADEQVRTIALQRIVLIADACPAVRPDRRGVVRGKIFRKGVGGLELKAVVESLGQADQQSVVPRSAGGLDLLHVWGVPPLKGNAQADIRDRVLPLASNRVCGACQISLVNGALSNEVKASRTRIAGLENQAFGKLSLQT